MIQILDSGVLEQLLWGTFDLVYVQGHLGAIQYTCLKLIVNPRTVSVEQKKKKKK